MRTQSSLVSFRLSLLAALGFGLAGCGDVVVNNGTGGAGGSGQGGGGSGSGAGPGTLCDGATPIPAADGTDSGFARCPDGTIHRVAAVQCDPAIGIAACDGSELTFYCTTDAECAAGPYGKCAHLPNNFGEPGPYCGCVYSCAEDADCGTGSVCVCAGVAQTDATWATCASSASCTTNADCPSGECGLSVFFDGCSYNVDLACRDAGDECRLDADCADGGTCASPYGTDAWSCQVPSCVIGRPLLVGGEARTAGTAPRRDWASRSIAPDIGAAGRDKRALRPEPHPDLVALEPAVREALAAHWEAVAALEHASIASFARFTLELLSMGAPPALLLDAQRAAADEVEHARIAYALASAYAGRPLGPAPLDVSGLAVVADRRAILRGLIEEACVGETLGVAEALAIADHCEDPALREVYARLATDEQRHAELAWRALRWLLDSEGADGRRFAAEVFERAMEAAGRDPEVRSAVRARGHGLLSSEELGALRRHALREVVAPCARALLRA